MLGKGCSLDWGRGGLLWKGQGVPSSGPSSAVTSYACLTCGTRRHSGKGFAVPTLPRGLLCAADPHVSPGWRLSCFPKAQAPLLLWEAVGGCLEELGVEAGGWPLAGQMTWAGV